MKKIILLFLILFSINVSAEEIVTVSSKVELNNENLSSETINKSALYVKEGDLLINNSQINKTGDGTFDNSNDFLNSAVTIYEKSKLSMNSCNIDTNGTYSNGLLLEKDSRINIKQTKITTNNNYSIGIVNNDANTILDNVTVETNALHSPALRAYNNKLEIINSNIITNEEGSPLLQVNGNVTIKDSTLKSLKSEGFLIIKNSDILLDNVKMEINNLLPSNIDNNYKSFMFYTPNSDSTDYKVNFSSKNSNLNSLNGDTFNILNINADINLENSEITNQNGVFLRGEKLVDDGKTYEINLNLNKQNINGDIILDETKNLKLDLKNSTFNGTINNDKKANNVDIILSKDSKLILTKDIYVNSLTNEDYENSNIELNGYNLYINNELLSTDNIIKMGYQDETFYLVLVTLIGIVLGFSIVYIINRFKMAK